MRVLVACEFSGVVRDAFRARGHDAWSCDTLPCEADPQYHYQCDVFEILNNGWDLLIAHPPCTYLCNSGVSHLYSTRPNTETRLYGTSRWVGMYEGAQFFKALLEAPIPKICVENPIPHKYAKGYIGPYTQIIHPWQYGHGETKATCLWLKNLPPLVPTNIVSERYPRVFYISSGPNRGHLRSITYQGFADAMADQWG